MEYKHLGEYVSYDHYTMISHLLSSISLAFAAILHADLPDTKARCIFHLALTLSLVHLEAFFSVGEQFNSYSLRYAYLLIILGLASFLWSSMLAHHLWKNFGKNKASDEPISNKPRLLLGYGIPCIFVFPAFVLASPSEINQKMFSYCIVPVALLFATVIQIVNIFFFIDLIRKAMKAVLLCKYDEGSAKFQEAIFRTLYCAILFVILALPWLIILEYGILSLAIEFDKPIQLISIIYRFLSAEGIILFLVLIIFHKYTRTYPDDTDKIKYNLDKIVYEVVSWKDFE